MLIGACVGALVAGSVMEIAGRRKVLRVTNATFVLGALMCAMAQHPWLLYLGRFVLGCACGGVAVVPVLLTELAPDNVRGQITTMHQLQITLGVLSSGLIGFFFVTTVSSGWRIVNGFLLLPSTLALVLHSSVPESPRWLLLAKGQDDLDPEKCLIDDDSMRSSTTSSSSGDDMSCTSSSPSARSTVSSSGSSLASISVSWSHVFSYRQQMWIGFGLVVFKSLIGFNTMIWYSSTIFQYAGVDNPVAVTASIGFSCVIATMVSIYIIGKSLSNI